MTRGQIALHHEPLAGAAAGGARGASAPRASLASRQFWSALWTTVRPYLAFVSGGAALVGLAFSGAPPARAAVAFVPLFLSYGFGQALTDCFQTDTDALSPIVAVYDPQGMLLLEPHDTARLGPIYMLRIDRDSKREV